MSALNDPDSRQLALLRAAFKHELAAQATPRRLGAYASSKGATITDFGAHSTRWISQFIAGRDNPTLFIP